MTGPEPKVTARKTRVAVLGGGIGAISAAFHLTSSEARDRFEVTVYQQGWRIGGKAASGRNFAPGTRHPATTEVG